jgi:FHS family glucose/mannose:H+ symporter-like MFS transporter
MFLPQVALAIFGSSAAPAFARRWTLKGVFAIGLAADLVSMALLALSAGVTRTPAAYGLLLLATGALGLGFGAAVMALNTFAEEFFPAASDRAVLAMNVLLGTGTALAPVLVAASIRLKAWWVLPSVIALALAILLSLAARALLPAADSAGATTNGSSPPPTRPLPGTPGRLWLYAGAALLYGIVETLNGNWSVVYLTQQRGVTAEWSSLALTAFWVMVTVGRLLASLASAAVPSRWIYAGSAAFTVLTLLVVASARTATGGVVAFGAAGLTCAALLPLTISFGGNEFPGRRASASGELIAFYQVGYGIAAFGVGPIQDAAQITLSAVYAAAAIVAAAMAALAFLIARPWTVDARGRSHGGQPRAR